MAGNVAWNWRDTTRVDIGGVFDGSCGEADQVKMGTVVNRAKSVLSLRRRCVSDKIKEHFVAQR